MVIEMKRIRESIILTISLIATSSCGLNNVGKEDTFINVLKDKRTKGFYIDKKKLPLQDVASDGLILSVLGEFNNDYKLNFHILIDDNNFYKRGINAFDLTKTSKNYENNIAHAYTINNSSIFGMTYLDESTIRNDLNYDIVGDYPAYENEIAITDYFLYRWSKFGTYLIDEESDYSYIFGSDINETNVLNKYMVIAGEKFKISGIIKTNIDYKKFEDKEKSLNDRDEKTELYYKTEDDVVMSFPNVIYVSRLYYSDSIKENVYDLSKTLSDKTVSLNRMKILNVAKENRTETISINLDSNNRNKNVFVSLDFLYELVFNRVKELLLNETTKTQNKTYYIYELDEKTNRVVKKEYITDDLFIYLRECEEDIYNYALHNLPKDKNFDQLAKEFCRDTEATEEIKAFIFKELIVNDPGEFIQLYGDCFSEETKLLVNDFYYLYSVENYKTIFDTFDSSYLSKLSFINKARTYFGDTIFTDYDLDFSENNVKKVSEKVNLAGYILVKDEYGRNIVVDDELFNTFKGEDKTIRFNKAITVYEPMYMEYVMKFFDEVIKDDSGYYDIKKDVYFVSRYLTNIY